MVETEKQALTSVAMDDNQRPDRGIIFLRRENDLSILLKFLQARRRVVNVLQLLRLTLQDCWLEDEEVFGWLVSSAGYNPLKILELWSLQICSTVMIEKITKEITQIKRLEELEIIVLPYQFTIEQEVAKELLVAAVLKGSLNDLAFYGTDVGVAGAGVLASAMQMNRLSRLETLYCEFWLGPLIVASAIHYCPALKALQSSESGGNVTVYSIQDGLVTAQSRSSNLALLGLSTLPPPSSPAGAVGSVASRFHLRQKSEIGWYWR